MFENLFEGVTNVFNKFDINEKMDPFQIGLAKFSLCTQLIECNMHF